jgi:hypothetical protein
MLFSKQSTGVIPQLTTAADSKTSSELFTLMKTNCLSPLCTRFHDLISLSRRPSFFSLAVLALCLLSTRAISQAQGEIHSGEAPTGAITPVGDLDTWTFSANAGDTLRVSIGELTDDGVGGGFFPRIRVFRPDAMLETSNFGNTAAALEFTATQTGTYQIRVDDAGTDGTGTYQLFLFKAPGDFVVPSGDDGGALVNGENHQGTVHLGDLDIWSFTASTGNSILLTIGELTDDAVGGGFFPEIRLYNPDGSLATSTFGNTAASLAHTATQTGRYLVVIDDAGTDGTGTYELHLARLPGNFVVPAGDDGGALFSTGHKNGTIHLGDLDLWTFVAYVGSSITLNIGELTDDNVGGGFFPRIRLYRPDGSFYTSNFGNTAAQVLINSADQGGTYTVVIDDAGTDGSGTYQLSYTRSFDPPRADFNGDAKPDWVFLKPSTGQLGIWLMNDAARLFSSAPPSLPSGWTLIDAEQFGGGANSADILIYNPSTRRSAIWYLNGAIRLSTAYGPILPSGWTLLLSQDFNGDTKPDLLLFQPTTHQTAIWYLNGVVHSSSAYGPTLPPGWIVAGAADFNRDERPDYLLYNASTRQTAIWYLNGPQFLSSHYGPTLPSGWAVAVVDDLNRDGKPDLVITNAATHQSFVLHLNNYASLGGSYGPSFPTGWVLKGPK